jgi:hypothetical protein
MTVLADADSRRRGLRAAIASHLPEELVMQSWVYKQGLDKGRQDGQEEGRRAARASRRQEGRREGRQRRDARRGLRRSIALALSVRGLHLDEASRARLDAEARVDVLEAWLARAVTAPRIADVFAPGVTRHRGLRSTRLTVARASPSPQSQRRERHEPAPQRPAASAAPAAHRAAPVVFGGAAARCPYPRGAPRRPKRAAHRAARRGRSPWAHRHRPHRRRPCRGRWGATRPGRCLSGRGRCRPRPRRPDRWRGPASGTTHTLSTQRAVLQRLPQSRSPAHGSPDGSARYRHSPDRQ